MEIWIVMMRFGFPIMSISLSKGGNISLTKTDPKLGRILVGLGWDARATEGEAFDLDASLFVLGAEGRVRTEKDFIFYNQLRSEDGSIEHTGDNRTGVGDGDDEAVRADLERIPAEVAKLAVAVSIYEADTRRQNFGMVRSAFIRVVNEVTGAEIARYDLSEDASTETAMIFGEVYRNGVEWKFRAVGQGFTGGLAVLAKQYGLDLG